MFPVNFKAETACFVIMEFDLLILFATTSRLLDTDAREASAVLKQTTNPENTDTCDMLHVNIKVDWLYMFLFRFVIFLAL